MTTNERIAVLETKVDVISGDICEIKADMKSHLEQSQKYNDKITGRIDMMLWTVLVGAVALVIKLVLF